MIKFRLNFSHGSLKATLERSLPVYRGTKTSAGERKAMTMMVKDKEIVLAYSCGQKKDGTDSDQSPIGSAVPE